VGSFGVVASRQGWRLVPAQGFAQEFSEPPEVGRREMIFEGVASIRLTLRVPPRCPVPVAADSGIDPAPPPISTDVQRECIASIELTSPRLI
jgi:hypothetical protein